MIRVKKVKTFNWHKRYSPRHFSSGLAFDRNKMIVIKIELNKNLHAKTDIKTRGERLKSALYLRLKKRKTFLLEKNLKFSKIFLFRKTSHSAEKCKRGALLIYKHAFCCKITKNSKGGLF